MEKNGNYEKKSSNIFKNIKLKRIIKLFQLIVFYTSLYAENIANIAQTKYILGSALGGECYDLKCTACDYCIFILTGSGGGNYNKTKIFTFINNANNLNKAVELWTNKAAPKKTYYSFEVYICPKCKTIENKFYLKMVTSKGKFEPDYPCSKCKTSLRRINVKIFNNDNVKLINRYHFKIKWQCPKCKNNKLIAYDIGMWD